MWHTCGFACWSQRLYHAMAVSTVPLLVNSGTLQPFERFVDWRKISVKVRVCTCVSSGALSLPSPPTRNLSSI